MLLLLLFTLTASFAQSANQTPANNFNWGAIDTLWGAIQDRHDAKANKYEIPVAKEIELENSHTEKKVPVRIALQNKAAETKVILIGIFGTTDYALYMGIAKGYYDRGFHVLVIPNTWGDQVRDANPDFLAGNMEAETEFSLELIQSGLDEIPANLRRQFSLVGVSYGSHLAVRVQRSLLQENDTAATSLTLIAPPLAMASAMRRLDALKKVDAERPECNGWSMDFKMLKALWMTESLSDLSFEVKNCAGAMLAEHAFFPSLKKLVSKIGEKIGFDGTFESYVKQYLGMTDANNQAKEQSSLETLLQDLGSQGFTKTIIFTAKNDVINQYSDWIPVYQNNIGRAKFWFFSRGGHGEFWRTSYFWPLIENSFL